MFRDAGNITMRKFQFWIAWRYFLGRGKERFVSTISLISVSGVAIGVAALIIVLGVMSGFDNELRNKIVGVYPHITVRNNFGIMFYRQLQERLARIPGVVASAPHINAQAFLRSDERIIPLYLRGIQPAQEAKISNIEDNIILGSLDSLNKGKNNIIIGRELSAMLGLGLGGQLELIPPTLKERLRFRISGVFASGMYNYDLNMAFISYERAEEINRVFNAAGDIGLKIKNLFWARRIKQEILSDIDATYEVVTWDETNKNFFDALKLEKITMFVILSLIILVASFAIAGTLIVMVTQKTGDIGILKSIGVGPGGIRNIFILQGFFIGIVGTGIGALLGLMGCLALKRYQFIRLPSDVYALDHLPVYLSWPDIASVAAAALLISVLATIYPASKAASLKPIEALRYE